MFSLPRLLPCSTVFQKFFFLRCYSINFSLNRQTSAVQTNKQTYNQSWLYLQFYDSNSKHCKAHSPETWITCLRLLFRNFRSRNRCDVCMVYVVLASTLNQTRKTHTHTQSNRKERKKERIQTRCLRCVDTFGNVFFVILHTNTISEPQRVQYNEDSVAAKTAAAAVVMAMLTTKSTWQLEQYHTHIQTQKSKYLSGIVQQAKLTVEHWYVCVCELQWFDANLYT